MMINMSTESVGYIGMDKKMVEFIKKRHMRWQFLGRKIQGSTHEPQIDNMLGGRRQWMLRRKVFKRLCLSGSTSIIKRCKVQVSPTVAWHRIQKVPSFDPSSMNETAPSMTLNRKACVSDDCVVWA